MRMSGHRFSLDGAIFLQFSSRRKRPPYGPRRDTWLNLTHPKLTDVDFFPAARPASSLPDKRPCGVSIARRAAEYLLLIMAHYCPGNGSSWTSRQARRSAGRLTFTQCHPWSSPCPRSRVDQVVSSSAYSVLQVRHYDALRTHRLRIVDRREAHLQARALFSWSRHQHLVGPAVPVD